MFGVTNTSWCHEIRATDKGDAMSGINVGRPILGGLAAGVVMFLAAGFLYTETAGAPASRP